MGYNKIMQKEYQITSFIELIASSALPEEMVLIRNHARTLTGRYNSIGFSMRYDENYIFHIQAIDQNTGITVYSESVKAETKESALEALHRLREFLYAHNTDQMHRVLIVSSNQMKRSMFTGMLNSLSRSDGSGYLFISCGPSSLYTEAINCHTIFFAEDCENTYGEAGNILTGHMLLPLCNDTYDEFRCTDIFDRLAAEDTSAAAAVPKADSLLFKEQLSCLTITQYKTSYYHRLTARYIRNGIVVDESEVIRTNLRKEDIIALAMTMSERHYDLSFIALSLNENRILTAEHTSVNNRDLKGELESLFHLPVYEVPVSASPALGYMNEQPNLKSMLFMQMAGNLHMPECGLIINREICSTANLRMVLKNFSERFASTQEKKGLPNDHALLMAAEIILLYIGMVSPDKIVISSDRSFTHSDLVQILKSRVPALTIPDIEIIPNAEQWLLKGLISTALKEYLKVHTI